MSGCAASVAISESDSFTKLAATSGAASTTSPVPLGEGASVAVRFAPTPIQMKPPSAPIKTTASALAAKTLAGAASRDRGAATAVRSASSPDETLLAFLHSTYEAAADLGHWDRPALERRSDPGKGERSSGKTGR